MIRGSDGGGRLFAGAARTETDNKKRTLSSEKKFIKRPDSTPLTPGTFREEGGETLYSMSVPNEITHSKKLSLLVPNTDLSKSKGIRY